MHISPSFPVLAGPAWSGVRILTTTRAGGVSQGFYSTFNLGDHVGDEPDRVRQNRVILQAALPAAPCWLQQVHGVTVHDASGAATDTAPQADAAISTQPGTVLAVLTADCLPVVIADVAATVVCVAHAGWRGLASGVLEAAVSAVYERRGQDAQLRAWVGPGIGPSAFEVGADVRDAFADLPQAFSPSRVAPGKWWCNLPWLAEQRLRSAGVVTVVQSGFCTVSEKDFYSYRRDGVTGRFATVAWLESAG